MQTDFVDVIEKGNPLVADKGTVLLVDDDFDALALLSNILERQGYRTFLARNGQDALKLAEEQWRTLDTVVLDINMPGGLDGYAVIDKLKNDGHTRSVPIAVLSARTSATDMARSYSAGAVQHICKPYDIKHLLAVIQSMVRVHCLERESKLNAEKYQAIVDNSPVQVVLVKSDCAILETNKHFRNKYPAAREGDSLLDIYGLTRAGDIENPILDAIATGETCIGEVEFQRDGEARYMSVRSAPLKDQDGRVESAIVIATDTTQQRVTEENLRKQVERYNRTIQQQDRTAEHLMAVQKELREKKEELERLSVTDELTLLNNRRFFNQTLSAEALRSGRYEHPLTLIMLDIDHFKPVNDTHGHDAGDIVLKDLAALLKRQLRETDTVARWGGEEFAIILPETPEEIGYHIGERLRQAVEAHDFQVPGVTLNLTVSLGVATICQQAINPQRLLKRADEALFEAKNGGRNQVIAVQ